MSYKINVNGAALDVDADGDTPLLWVLRDHLGMTGTKFGCGIAQCGACTVHVDGYAMRSCQFKLEDVGEAEIVTIEGLSENNDHPLQKIWAEMNVPQCGYCQAGMIMAASAMLEEVPDPTDEDIDTYMSNICRCGTYPRVRAAIHAAVETMKG